MEPIKNSIKTRGDHFRFGSVFIKKSNQTKIFFFEKKNETEPKPGQTDRFRFGFFRAKTGSNRFGSVFPVLARFSRFWLGFFRFWLGFSGLARFRLGLAQFFSGFLSVSVRFGFFGFLVIKPKPNRTGRFFQKFNRFNWFFFRFGFFGYFFSGFLGLIGFPVFLLTPNKNTVSGEVSCTSFAVTVYFCEVNSAE